MWAITAMKSALTLGIFGVLSIAWVSTQVLGLTPSFALAVVLVSWAGSFLSLILTLRASDHPKLKVILKGWIRQWGMLVGIFFAVFFGLLPEMLDTQRFIWLIVPVLCSMGFTVIAFGPVQDRYVRKRQLKGK